MTVIDSIKSYIPSSVQNRAGQVITWGKAPVTESPIYQGISNGASKGLTKLAEKAGEIAVKNEGTQSFLGKMIGKAASYIAPAANTTKGFLGKMTAAAGAVPKFFTKGNVAIASLLEAPEIIEGVKQGRGIRQTIQSATKVGSGVAGGLAATAGAALLLGTNPVGWAAIGIAVAGSAIGYMVGGKATSFLGHNKSKEQTAVAQQPPAQFGSMTMPNGAAGSMAFDFNNPLAGLPQLQ